MHSNGASIAPDRPATRPTAQESCWQTLARLAQITDLAALQVLGPGHALEDFYHYPAVLAVSARKCPFISCTVGMACSLCSWHSCKALLAYRIAGAALFQVLALRKDNKL